MRLAYPQRENQGQAATQNGDAERHDKRRQKRNGVDAAQERQELHHRQGASNQTQDRHESRSQLAEDDLAVGQISDEQVRQRSTRSVEADRPGGCGRSGQEHECQLRADQGDKKMFAKAGHRADGAGDRELRPGPGAEIPDDHEGDEQEKDECHPQRVPLPAPRRREPLIGEYWARAQAVPSSMTHVRAFPSRALSLFLGDCSSRHSVVRSDECHNRSLPATTQPRSAQRARACDW